MARFDRIDTSKYDLLYNCECYIVKGTLTLDDVSKLNSINREIVLIFENTKGQNSGVIGSLNPHHIKISVIGGLDYLHKRKFSGVDYIQRTFYTPRNLANIIKAFESIERKIPYSWSESQKCMFVYKTLVEKMHYQNASEGEFENGVDVARTLNGLLANRSVCSGFALIFKEAMDRLGIECYYQNMSHHHSWNVVRLDGNFHLLDMTWDVCNKSANQQCTFRNFCMQDSTAFYANKHHDLSSENEEIRFVAKAQGVDKLQSDFERICKSLAIYSSEMQHYTNEKGLKFDFLTVGETKGLRTFIIRKGEDIDYYYINGDADIRRVLDDDLLAVARTTYAHNISRSPLPPGIKTFKKFVRDDGTQFLIHKTSAKLKGDVNEYFLIEPAYENEK